MFSQDLTFKAAASSVLPLVSVTTTAWDFFCPPPTFCGANWNNPASSANMNESQAFREAAGLLSVAAPYWATLLYTETGMDCLPCGQSHKKWHPLSAMWKPAAYTCWCSSIKQRLQTDTDTFVVDWWESFEQPRLASTCCNVCMLLQSVKVTACCERITKRGRSSELIAGGNVNSSVSQFYDFILSNPTASE